MNIFIRLKIRSFLCFILEEFWIYIKINFIKLRTEKIILFIDIICIRCQLLCFQQYDCFLLYLQISLKLNKLVLHSRHCNVTFLSLPVTKLLSTCRTHDVILFKGFVSFISTA